MAFVSAGNVHIFTCSIVAGVTPLRDEAPVFDYKQLSKAILIRDQSYKLLLWMSDAVDRREIQPSRIEHHSNSPEATEDWLRINLKNIPDEIRPGEDDLSSFAAFFSTYLTSSFDIVDGRASRGEGLGSCRCEVCMTIINAPHLRSKKLYARDKRRAEHLMEQSLSNFAAQSLRLSEQLMSQLLAVAKSCRWIAYISYGDWLIRRLSGESDGPAILALWRIIAWDPRGGVRRGFRLRLDGFKDAEQNLRSAIRNEG